VERRQRLDEWQMMNRGDEGAARLGLLATEVERRQQVDE
jgi:hypothetical protein